MTKIVAGKIVRDETVLGASNSPNLPRRRSSLQELQLKEFQLQQEQKAKEASDQQQEQQLLPSIETPTWKQISSQSIRVFGLKMNILVLLGISIISIVGAGVMGLLCSLLAVYIGTLFTTQNLTPTSPPSPTASSPSSSAPVVSESTPVAKSSPIIARSAPLISAKPSISAPPINAAQEILSRRNSVTITNGGTISPRPCSPLSSPLSMRSPRFATLSSIAEVRDQLPMLDAPAC